MGKRYAIGLLIGRFQPLHLGHAYLIRKALEVCSQTIIGIGSSNIINQDNPWTYKKRRKMLEDFIEHEGLQDKIIKIFPIPDIPDDNAWFEDLIKRAGKFDILIGNNNWVNIIFKSHNYNVLTIEYYKRDELEGQRVRKLMREKKNWEDRVPSCLIDMIRENLYRGV